MNLANCNAARFSRIPLGVEFLLVIDHSDGSEISSIESGTRDDCAGLQIWSVWESLWQSVPSL